MLLVDTEIRKLNRTANRENVVNTVARAVTRGFLSPHKQQSPLSQEKSPGGTSEVKQYHQYLVYRHPEQGNVS